jgi:hypothetical protein
VTAQETLPGLEPPPPHTCHRTGCDTVIPPKLFMCGPDWRSLPPELQKRIWALYRPGQEIRKDPSAEYLEAAREAIAWLGPKP